MADTHAAPAQSLRPRRRSRFWVRLGLIAILLLAVPVLVLAWGWYQRQLDYREWQAAVAELDRTEPGWRLADLEKGRREVPDDENAALVVAPVLAALPAAGGPGRGLSEVRKLSPLAPLGDKLAETLRTEVAPYAAALAAGRRLKDYPRGRFPPVQTGDYSMPASPDHQTRLLNLSRLLTCEAHLAADRGDLTMAWDLGLAAYNAGAALGDEPALMAQLIRMNSRYEAVRTLERVLARGEVPQESLTLAQQTLEADA